MIQFTFWSFKRSLRGSVLVPQPAVSTLKNKHYPCDFSTIKEFSLAAGLLQVSAVDMEKRKRAKAFV